MVKGSGGSLNIWIKKLENKNKKKQQTNLIFLPVWKLTRIFSQFFQEDNKKQQEYAPTTTQHYDGPHSERPPFFAMIIFHTLVCLQKKMQFYKLIKRGFYEPSNNFLILFHCIYTLWNLMFFSCKPKQRCGLFLHIQFFFKDFLFKMKRTFST